MEIGKRSEQRRPYVMVIVRMTKPFGILFLSKPTDDDVMETLGNLIMQKNKELDDCFEIQRKDITGDIEATIED